MWVTTIHSISLYTRLVFNSSVHMQLFDFLEKKNSTLYIYGAVHWLIWLVKLYTIYQETSPSGSI